jgi:hypothetical protein
MNIERILKRFEDRYRSNPGIRTSPRKAKNLIKKYQSIPLTLPISDESMRRVCEVLTRSGYTTKESCEGHHKKEPRIYLECVSPYHLRHLTNILLSESGETNYPWNLRTYTGEVFVNPHSNLKFIMSPDISFITQIKPKDYDNMIDDLDIIGISVLRYFSSVNLKSIEKERKKVDAQAGTFKIPNVPRDYFRK